MDSISTILAFLVAHPAEILSALTSIVGVGALVASVTPNTSDNKFWDAVLKGINFIGANFGKARNDPSIK